MAATAPSKKSPHLKNKWLKLILQKKLVRLKNEWLVATPRVKLNDTLL